ncbi:MAG: S-methyl-5'-thioadenosine phosphorylase [bacterium]
MESVKIGVIGGSGLAKIDELEIEDSVKVDTPFGEPSDEFLVGTISGVRVAFLSRHGKGHHIPPTHLNYRANIWGMKKLGVERIIASGACGSLKEDLPPGHIVVVDQYIDRTRHRVDSFSGPGLVIHAMFADPVCTDLSNQLYESGKNVGAAVHNGGTYICMEGPQFSTRAESRLYRSWNADVIGMTNLTEARLAREAEICYGSLALVTDFDCWHESEEDVTIDMVIRVMQKNAETFRSIIKDAIPKLPAERYCPCKEALKYAVITEPEQIPEKVKQDLDLVLKKYI